MVSAPSLAISRPRSRPRLKRDGHQSSPLESLTSTRCLCVALLKISFLKVLAATFYRKTSTHKSSFMTKCIKTRASNSRGSLMKIALPIYQWPPTISKLQIKINIHDICSALLAVWSIKAILALCQISQLYWFILFIYSMRITNQRITVEICPNMKLPVSI